MTLGPGQVLNQRYRIAKLLGQGGFGAVYKAWDLNMERPRALKENLETSEEAQRQFKREAQILGDLTHPNMPKVIDHFVIPGQGQYLVMEFVEGEDLEEILLKQGSVIESQALVWMQHVCDALNYLHTQNPPVIHRDIKPANIKIHPGGRAMLVDFGIAKTFNANIKTTVGARAVTPGYSPQEQYGMGVTDARTDIYALGATLYHLLTARQPPESIQRAIDAVLIPPRQLNKGISASTEAAILKAMAMHPSQRFQTAAEFRRALEGSIPVVAPSKNPPVVEPIMQVQPAGSSAAYQNVAAPAHVQSVPVSAGYRAASPDPSPQLTAMGDGGFPLPFQIIGSLGLVFSGLTGILLMDETEGFEVLIWPAVAWVLLLLYALRLDNSLYRGRKRFLLLLAASALLIPLVIAFSTEGLGLALAPLILGIFMLSLGRSQQQPGLLFQGLAGIGISTEIVALANTGIDENLLISSAMFNLITGLAALAAAIRSRRKIPSP